MTRNKLYLLTGTLLTAAYGYLGWAQLHSHSNNGGFSPCLFKNVTGIACPSCGSTRSVIHLTHGNVSEAAFTNPLGFIVAALMLILPLWLLLDILLKKDSFYLKYRQAEDTIRTKWVAIPLILLVTANWIWNIQKGL